MIIVPLKAALKNPGFVSPFWLQPWGLSNPRRPGAEVRQKRGPSCIDFSEKKEIWKQMMDYNNI
jgi:hypothetical protein